MTSPWTTSWSPLQDRYQIRREFERWLPKHDGGKARYKSPTYDEEALIALCRRYRLEFGGASDEILMAWDACPGRINDKCPTSAELRQMGWLVFDGGRWARSSDEPENGAKAPPLNSRTERFLDGLARIDLVERGNPGDLSAPALEVKRWVENRLDEELPVRDASWLARRLWTELCRAELADVVDLTADDESVEYAASTDGKHVCSSQSSFDGLIDRTFLQWQAWCELLHCPAQWDYRWSALERRFCHEAAIRVLNRQQIWRDWETVVAQVSAANREGEIAEIRSGSQKEAASNECSVFNRFDYLNRQDVQRLVMDQLLQSSSIGFAFGLLCSEIEHTSGGTRIEASIKAVMDLVADHPIAMQHLIFKVHNAPVLLVDMLLSERTAAWAVRVIMQYPNFGGRLAEYRAVSDTQMKSFAIRDSLSILAHQFQSGRADLLELASLITWCYSACSQVSQEDSERIELIGRELLGMMASGAENDQSLVLQHLMGQARGDWNPSKACFKVLLDAARILPVSSHLDLSPVVSLYVRICRDLKLDRTDASWLPATFCASLVEIGLSSSSSGESLLRPVDARGIAHRAYSKHDHAVQYSLAKTLRTHVQLLARAISGWPSSSVPKVVVDALLELISTSVIQHGEKGCVPALTDRYAPDRIFRKEQTSPAQDLTQAWRALRPRQQQAMLRAIAESDDPAFLAEICVMLPNKKRGPVRTKLRSMGPTTAASVWTWSEMERRISLLLDADERDVARQHLNAIESLSLKAPIEVKRNIFDLRLRLLFKERDWPKLDKLSLPESLDPKFARQAEDSLLFWRATSQLVRSGGDLTKAKLVFDRLAARHGSAIAYRENAYAAALRLLLDTGPHPLGTEMRLEGEKLLVGMNEFIQKHGSEVSSSLLTNRGVLLVALDRSEEALESLAPIRAKKKALGLEHVAALAMSKLGRNEEARTVLDAAIGEFGRVSDLVELRASLSDGITLNAPVVVATKIDALSSIQSSLQKMRELQPTEIAQLFEPSGGGLRGFLVRIVSRSVAGLQHMGAILRDRGHAKCVGDLNSRQDPRKSAKYENDLNTALREILNARLAFIRWDVADQSLGGSTEKGNLGERDLVIRASGQEVAVLEALVCKSVDKENIKAHFHKLIAYGQCGIYFHIIYAYKPLGALLSYIDGMITTEVPACLSYRRHTPLDYKDHEVAGLIATYEYDHRQVDVVFLIVELSNIG
ncbi:hypothetical protein ABE493_08215 [Stenotrophomonas terrae]|uniref:hypothetical protein n=1 Tax=Stenotrophomonas terrae TaxID=405446 RepID=UPI00320B17B0